jgi:hypothetical protein
MDAQRGFGEHFAESRKCKRHVNFFGDLCEASDFAWFKDVDS